MKRTIVLLALLGVGLSVQADEASERIARDLLPTFRIEGEPATPQTVSARLAHHGIPALSVAFAIDGEIAWAKAWGSADVEAARPATADTFFLAGSISKPVAALRAHQLVEEGRVDLDTNVNDYLTRWQVPDNEFTTKEKVTLRRILNHTAGLTVWGFPGYDKGDDVPSVEDVLDGKGNTAAVRVYKEPGDGWQYSGGGYTIMQLMIEEVDGRPFAETLETSVLRPLGMSSSTFTNPLPEPLHARAATGYRSNGTRVEGDWPIYPEMAAAGLWTTPSELIAYAIDVQHVDQDKGSGLLDRTTVEAMLTPGANNHGLGPVVNGEYFGHGGADEGFRAQLAAWRNSPYALVAMVNSDTSTILAEFIQAVAREYDLPGFEQNVKHPVDLTAAQLETWTGQYKIEDVGLVTIEASAAGLMTNTDFGFPDQAWRPLGPDRFFSTATGQEISFALDSDVASVFFSGIVGRRID